VRRVAARIGAGISRRETAARPLFQIVAATPSSMSHAAFSASRTAA
jgi:hypothetical protein